eukprot:gnl/MRDRNA2_/MRDRNA2_117727_c0_seq1.p1 gnl/MRDRNA2_/MRDRNA2_117727_c0~~gnl/MRDRNA2_/MRDRNA2_117727_c0_seq1.p1  ORF type:complete len:688 (-),score=85.97 gnl/MRDRNA2_/MRDRNA2_117727_c0_seq1:12-1871(-)
MAAVIILLTTLQGLSALSFLAEESPWVFMSIRRAAVYANYYFLWIFSTVIFRDHNPLGASLYFLAFAYGCGSLAAAFSATYGCISKKSNFVLALGVWKAFCLLSSVLLYGYVIGFNTLGLGFWLNSLICVLLIVLDTWIVFTMAKVYLMIFSWEHFQRGVSLAMESAQNLALEHGHGHCDTIHILAGLSNQYGVDGFLRAGNVDPSSFQRFLAQVSELHSGERRPPGTHLAPFTTAAHNALHHALVLQEENEDKRLRLEHIILALWDCQLSKARDGINLDREKCMKELAKRKAEEIPPITPKAPKILGCLPLEETVFVYICLEVIWCITSIICVLFYGVSATWIIGLKTTRGMRALEFCVSFLGLVLGVYFGLASIWRHRIARLRIQQASVRHVGKVHAQELDVQEAASLLRGEPQTSEWLGVMRVSAARLSVYLVFDVMRAFIAMPMALMALVVGNVCGSYVHGIANLSLETRMFSNELPMHCTSDDFSLLCLLGFVCLLDLYIIWSILSLWHEYAFGWTTTDVENAMYIDPMNFDPYQFVWLAGGVPEGSTLLKDHPELAPPAKGKMKSATGKEKVRRARKEPAGEHFLGALKAAMHHRPTMEESFEKFRRELVFAM